MDTPGLTPIELAYLAGFFDGEGCVQSDGRTVGITNTFPDVLHRFKRAFGGRVSPKATNRDNPGGKALWRWGISGIDARNFLQTMIPLLVEKRPQAEAYLSAWMHGPKTMERVHLLKRLRDLKHVNYPHPQTA